MTSAALPRRPETASHAPEPPGRAASLSLAFTAASALIVVAARIWFQTDVRAVVHSSELISYVSIVHGMVLFVVLGRDRITMPGYFMAGSAVIVGLSGLFVIPDPSFLGVPHPQSFLNTALMVSTLTQIGVGALCMRFSVREHLPSVVLPDALVRWSQVMGIAALSVTLVLGDALDRFQGGFGFAAILLICSTALLSRRGIRNPVNIALIIGTLIAYPTLVISGLGRLQLIALVLAVGYIFFLRYGRRWMKSLGVLLAPIMLVVLGAWRRAFEESVSGQVGNETGLSSMFVTIGNFGTLIHATGQGLAPTLGTSLLSPLRSALPDAMTPAWIPEAIGYELAAITDPELYDTGFSTAATIYGDLWWNFGALGLVAGVPILAVVLDRLDAWTVRSYERASQGPRQFLLLMFFSALLGGVGDLVWAGTHIWIVRMYGRVAALLILAGLTFYLPARILPVFVSFRGGDTRTSPSAVPAAPESNRPGTE